MSTVAESGLFPPEVDAYVPAINIESVFNESAGETPGFFIEYDIGYNNAATIKSVHVSLTRQSNYETAYSDGYARGVYITKENFEQVSGNRYKVLIPASILAPAQLHYNEYYKVQVRLSTDDDFTEGITGIDLSNYLTDENNLLCFSEWSTVCLIKFIAPPIFSLDANGQVMTGLTFDSSNITLSGVYQKGDAPDTITGLAPGTDEEYLSGYQVKVYDSSSVLVFDSGNREIERDTPNAFVYTIPYYFTSSTYSINITYTTANLYSQTDVYPIAVSYPDNSWGAQDVVGEVVMIDTSIGKVNISFAPIDNEVPIPAGSKFMIRRGSDKDDFAIWDQVYYKTLTSAVSTQISFDDFTIESGTLYKYEINYIDTSNTIYRIVEGPILSVFDHAFLTGLNTQLCVKFNPQISGYKTNLGDNMLNTIGGQFPKFSRNGNMKYRSFTLSGSIAYEMDVQHQFATRSSMYGEWMQVYGSYFVNHFINQQNDRVTQRKFRELVMAYFDDETPKLFRSTPEGNILVRLSDVSYNPKNELGRMIYDFSCTATEIGEATIENCKLYQIQSFGD